MTYAPRAILDARTYLLDELDAQPGVARHADLEANEVGIVGNLATHFSGYHLGWDRIRQNLGRGDYSVSESSRDSKPTDGASALDIGEFSVKRGDRRLTLPDLSLWIVTQCKAGTPDTRDIREVIYSPDGRVVRRWDRLGVRSGGDSTHLYHTHISYFRDSEGRDKAGLFRRYIEEDDVALSESDLDKIEDRIDKAVYGKRIYSPALGVGAPGPTVGEWWIKGGQAAAGDLGRVRATLAGIAAAVSGQDIVAAVRAELAAWGPALAEQLAPLLAEELREVPPDQVEAAVVRALARTRLAVDGGE